MERINNSFYETLNEEWHTATNHPIALLRAENRLRNPWILSKIPHTPSRVLDLGCGAGFLANTLALAGHHVEGVDLSPSSLAVAAKHDSTGSVRYREANACALPYPDGSFDVVCAMDLLEHVENPGDLIREASRVLKPKGLFFFHTFNRNLLSYLLVIKGVEWGVPNAPPNMHVYPLFIKPAELEALCASHSLQIQELLGVSPNFSWPFWKMVFTRRIEDDLSFRFTRSLATGYTGVAQKN